MTPGWDDEYLTVAEIAEHLKLNQQTVRNWIDQDTLPAVRTGRRVRVRRADLDRILAEGATATRPPEPPAVEVGDPREQLLGALGRARHLLGRRSAARRVELAEGLQELTDTVAAVLEMRSDESTSPPSDSEAAASETRAEDGSAAEANSDPGELPRRAVAGQRR
jgi:excisionase family DNA binding protein